MRTGVNVTVVLPETVSGAVVLFFAGRHQAGEIFDGILTCRMPAPGAPRLVRVTDAAFKRFDHQRRKEIADAICSAHVFLILPSVKDKHPAEHTQTDDVFNAVFDNDDEAKRPRTPNERMLFLRKRSMPLMEKLMAMGVKKLKSKLIESSSALWAPRRFIISQWLRLTRFCDVPGVLLNSTLVEQKLIIPVRSLAASFNDQTSAGGPTG